MQQGIQMLDPVAETTGLVSRTRVERTLVAPTLLAVPALNYTFVSADLKEGSEVRGSLQVVGSREVALYVMNEGNFTLWRSGHSSTVVLARPIAISYNFTISVPASDSYYFIFDNQDSARRSLIFSLSVIDHEVTMSPIVMFADYELLAAGLVLIVFGLRGGKKAVETSPAKPEVATVAELPKCRFCGATLTGDRVFCDRCGRSQK
jgi:hypothetical protein